MTICCINITIPKPKYGVNTYKYIFLKQAQTNVNIYDILKNKNKKSHWNYFFPPIIINNNLSLRIYF